MPTTSTFSIVAFDPSTDEIGVAVQSKFLSVGAVVPWIQAGVGAIATQAWANTTYGPRGLAMLRQGRVPEEVVAALTGPDDNSDQRQIGIVDCHGRTATFTGSRCLEWAGGKTGDNLAVQGNILAGPRVIEAMADAFARSSGALADRMIAVLRAGQAAGGDRRGKQSAALDIAKPAGGYGGFNDRYIDLRVDDHPDPIEELARILELHKLYFFPPTPDEILPVGGALGSEIVALLKRAGALPASAPNQFDAQAQGALVAFMHRENLEDRARDDGCIDKQTLGYLRAFES